MKGDTMKSANPYLNFNGNTEEAFDFYRSVFGGEFQAVVRFKDFGDAMPVPEKERNKIAHVALPLGKHNVLMGTDVLESQGQALRVGNNFYITLEPENAQEAQNLFDKLASGGKIEMPLQQTEWADKFGICADRFGVQWMLDFTGSVQYPAGKKG
jgi:PhnB protein